MKTLITTLNSKYIHKSLALRLLYVATKDHHDVSFKEYTIKDDLDRIVHELLSLKIDVLAFSIYIWNVELIKEIIAKIKKERPELIIVIGGPEVSYEIDYFLDNFEIDYLISGEGEVAFKQLLDCLEAKQMVKIQGISTKDDRDYRQTKPVDLSYLETLDSPYLLECDLKDMANRILYFETSRGCPYRCQYCLSSLEKGLRFFSLDYLKKQLKMIIDSGVKTVKLLDRSFNAKTSHALAILEFIFKNYRPGIQFQFEINGDVLDQKIIDYINEFAPDGLLRFEIGIQSTYEPTNEIVKRYQDFNRLSEVIRQLQTNHKIDFHLDLIAGLPLENLERFAKSFDDVFAFYPKELQLGFLKLLRGTSLRNEANQYGYVYDDRPPYELIESNDLSKDDIKQIHLVEEMLEKFWNSGKMPLTLKKVISEVESPFYFFLDLGNYYLKHQFKMFKFQNDELFSYLNQFLNGKYQDLLIEDYLRLAKVKPKRWWVSSLDKKQAKVVMHSLVEKYHLDQEVLFRYGLIEKISTGYIVAIYKDYQVTINKYQL
ncbi:B12-binding domain-containing radical SAM protein [Thomasclavelia sp.]|uniref:B12-binding domain-containing radical SAM protein n=1 Tax=Thomasclavelia sp. TaxID=3025757 RepID=UPI0025E1C5B0|nr:B12-binding domain-containing radical SAM protein [Thomasclavelia sp.]